MKYILLLFCVTIVGCNNNSTTTVSAYYDIDSLVTAQVEYLGQNASLLKKRSLEDTISISSEQVDWQAELEIFQQLDINKPSLSDAYKIQDGLDDANSNLTILRYSPVYGNPNVQQIELHYLGSINNLKRLRAKTKNNNELFDSYREFYMEFDQKEGMSILKRYSIQGNQKLVMRDSMSVGLSAEIVY